MEHIITCVMSRLRNALRWTHPVGHLHQGSDNKRFQYCVNPDGFIQHMRAIHGHWWITRKSRTCGVSTFITLVLLSIFILLSTQDWLQEERIQKKEGKQYSSQPWVLWLVLKKMNHTTWQNHEWYRTKISGKCAKMQYIGSIPRNCSRKGLAFWQTRSNAFILHDSVPADCLEKVLNTKTGEIQYQRSSLSPRPPPNN